MDSSCPTGPVTIDHNVIYAYRVTPIQSGCASIDTSGGNSIADPLFADYGNRNLQLQAGSPALDQATPAWSEQHDHNGVGRPQGAGPDIGAYER